VRLVTTEATRVGGRGAATAAAAAAAATTGGGGGGGRPPVPVAEHEVSAGGSDFVPGRVDGEGDDFFFALILEGREGGREVVNG